MRAKLQEWLRECVGQSCVVHLTRLLAVLLLHGDLRDFLSRRSTAAFSSLSALRWRSAFIRSGGTSGAASDRLRPAASWRHGRPCISISSSKNIHDNAGFGLTELDLFLGAAIILISVEASRRVLGWPISIIALVFLAYLFIGPWIPGPLHHSGFIVRGGRVESLCLDRRALRRHHLHARLDLVPVSWCSVSFWCDPARRAFYSDLCLSLLGQHPGGGAKAAVTSSMIVGSITGSAAANVAITGVITIPLMIRSGYKPHIAAGIEAAASTGGTVLPPVMGRPPSSWCALTGIPYSEIALYSAIPAVIYYLVVFLSGAFLRQAQRPQGLAAGGMPAVLTSCSGAAGFISFPSSSS